MKVMFEGQHPGPAAQAPPDQYAALWLQIRVWRVWHLRRFVAAIAPVIKQAREHPSVRRFGFEISWCRLRFRTFAAFETRDAMHHFVTSGAHGEIQRRLRGRLGTMSASYATIAAADLPTHWAEVHAAVFPTQDQTSKPVCGV